MRKSSLDEAQSIEHSSDAVAERIRVLGTIRAAADLDAVAGDLEAMATASETQARTAALGPRS